MRIRSQIGDPIMRVGEYRGQKNLDLFATQLVSTGRVKQAEARRILQEWIEFFAAEPTRIRRLNLCSHVPQDFLDSLVGQNQLETLELKWGNYSNIAVLSKLTKLRRLSLGGAKKVTDLSPLASLPRLRDLTVDQAFLAPDLSPISRLVSLRELTYGNGYPGSDKIVDFSDFEWIRPLKNLRVLRMPGSRPLDPDLSVLMELPRLVKIALPLRRAYRKQVFVNAKHSKAFAGLAKDYEWLDAFRARTP